MRLQGVGAGQPRASCQRPPPNQGLEIPFSMPEMNRLQEEMEQHDRAAPWVVPAAARQSGQASMSPKRLEQGGLASITGMSARGRCCPSAEKVRSRGDHCGYRMALMVSRRAPSCSSGNPEGAPAPLAGGRSSTSSREGPPNPTTSSSHERSEKASMRLIAMSPARMGEEILGATSSKGWHQVYGYDLDTQRVAPVGRGNRIRASSTLTWRIDWLTAW